MLFASERKANQERAFDFIIQHNNFFLFNNEVDGVYIIAPGYIVPSDNDLVI